MSLISGFQSFGMAAVAVYLWLVVSATKFNCRGPSLIPGRAEHIPANFSDIVNPLLMTSDG